MIVANGQRLPYVKTIGFIWKPLGTAKEIPSRKTWGDCVIVPLYDNEDSVCGIEYNGTPYFFVKNLQGDVIAITNSSGDVVARYTYDAWGACTITQDNPHTIARLNPFRYRGYYYDGEIGMYYLQSRHYDPQVGRFINADDVIYIAMVKEFYSSNVFVYCKNNSVCHSDPSGYWYYTTREYYNYANSIPNKKANKVKRAYLMAKYTKYFNNYYQNVALFGDRTGYVCSQNQSKIKDMCYDEKTVSYSGCGVIAIYNLMKSIGRWMSLPQVILECEMNDLTILGGTFGTKHKNIKKFFNAHSVSYKYYEKESSFIKKLNAFKQSCIVVYWNNKRYTSKIHIFFFSKIGKQYTVYNGYGASSTGISYKQYRDAVGGRTKFICGYII